MIEYKGLSLEDKCSSPQTKGYVTQTGVPLSAVISEGQYSGTLAAVIKVEGRHVLGYVRNSMSTNNLAEAAALLLSEITDGDNTPITWSGILHPDGLQIKEIHVHDYLVTF